MNSILKTLLFILLVNKLVYAGHWETPYDNNGQGSSNVGSKSPNDNHSQYFNFSGGNVKCANLGSITNVNLSKTCHNDGNEEFTVYYSCSGQCKGGFSFTAYGANNPVDYYTISGTWTNLAPTITSSNIFSIAENSTSVGTITSYDKNGDTLTYSIVGGADSGSFTVNSSSGLLEFNSAPNYELKNVYEVQVRVTDNGSGAQYATQMITVNVTNVHEKEVVKEYNEYSYTPSANPLISVSATNLPDWLELKPGIIETFAGTGARATTNGGVYDSANGTPAISSKINSGRMYVDASSRVFYADTEEYGIRYIDASGNIQTFYAGNGTYQNLNPTAVVYDDVNDVVYVTDYSKHKVSKITSGGVKTDIATGLKYYPQSLLHDSVNNVLYVGTRSTIYKIDLTNNSKTVVAGKQTFHGSYSHTGTASTSALNTITSMAFDSLGRMLIVEKSNLIIRRIDLVNDTIELIAGTQGQRVYEGDGGLAINATFRDPSSLVLDTNDEIYVSERLDRVIRKISTDGTIDLFKRVSASSFIDSMAIDKTNGDFYIQSTYKVMKLVNNTTLSGTPTVSGVYNINLDKSDGSTDNFQITVIDVNDAPILEDKSFVVSEDNAVGTSMGTINASDEDGVSPSIDLIGSAEPITYAIESGNTNNDFAIDSVTGEITIANELNAYYQENYILMIKAQDDDNASDSVTVVINVSDKVDAPIAVADSSVISEDSNVTINLVANDTDKDNNINLQSVVITKKPENGSAILDANGIVKYTPDAHYFGSDYFTYKIYDKTGLTSNEINATITINAVNDTPTTSNAVLSTPEDIELSTTMNQYVADEDGKSDIQVYNIVNDVSHGTLSLANDGLMSYQPDNNYYGMDSFTFSVEDASGSVSNTSTVYINIAEVNDVPVAYDDFVSTNEDTPLVVNVLGNDIDDGDLNITSVAILNQPTNGTATVNIATGEITYTPKTNWYGSDTFEYTVKDDGLATAGLGSPGILISNAATVLVEVVSVNDTPIAVADSFNIDEDNVMLMNLHLNDTDIESDLNGHGISIVSQPVNGDINVTEDGLVRFVPDKDYDGLDSFTYRISDGDLNSSIVTVNLAMIAQNDKPKIVTDIADLSIEEDNGTINFALDILDVEYDNLNLSIESNDTSIIQATQNWTNPLAKVDYNGITLDFDLSTVVNANGVVRVTINLDDGDLNTSKSFDINVTAVDDAADINMTTPNGNEVGIDINATEVVTTRDGSGTTSVKYSDTNLEGDDYNSSVELKANGEITSNIATSEGSSTLKTDDTDKTIHLNNDGSITTQLTTPELNTTFEQLNSGNVQISTVRPDSISKDISTALPNSAVIVDTNVTTITGTPTNEDGLDINVSIIIGELGDLNTSLDVNGSSLSVLIPKDVNSTTDVDEYGTVTNSVVNGRTTTNIVQGSDGRLNANYKNSRGVVTKLNFESGNDVVVTVDANGSTSYVVTNDDNSMTEIIVNQNGTPQVIQKDAGGNIISDALYPAGSTVNVDTDGKISIVRPAVPQPVEIVVLTDGDTDSTSISYEEFIDDESNETMQSTQTAKYIIEDENGTLIEKNITTEIEETFITTVENGVEVKSSLISENGKEITTTSTIKKNGFIDISVGNNINDVVSEISGEKTGGEIYIKDDGETSLKFEDTNSDGEEVSLIAFAKADGTVEHIVTFRSKETGEEISSEVRSLLEGSKTIVNTDNITTTVGKMQSGFLIQAVALTNLIGETHTRYEIINIETQEVVVLDVTVDESTPFEPDNKVMIEEDDNGGIAIKAQTKLTKKMIFK